MHRGGSKGGRVETVQAMTSDLVIVLPSSVLGRSHLGNLSPDGMNMDQRAVQPGQVYRSTESRFFGGTRLEWRVVSVARRNDDRTYATLVMNRDPSERKTLAVGALMDRRMYGLVADAPADEMDIPER